MHTCLRNSNFKKHKWLRTPCRVSNIHKTDFLPGRHQMSWMSLLVGRGPPSIRKVVQFQWDGRLWSCWFPYRQKLGPVVFGFGSCTGSRPPCRQWCRRDGIPQAVRDHFRLLWQTCTFCPYKLERCCLTLSNSDACHRGDMTVTSSDQVLICWCIGYILTLYAIRRDVTRCDAMWRDMTRYDAVITRNDIIFLLHIIWSHRYHGDIIFQAANVSRYEALEAGWVISVSFGE